MPRALGLDSSLAFQLFDFLHSLFVASGKNVK